MGPIRVVEAPTSRCGNPGGGTVILGAGSNVLSADSVNIGLSKANGTLKFASSSPGSPGTVTIGGKSGASADLLIGGKTATGTAATPVGTLDLRGHPAYVDAATVTIAKEDSSSTGFNGGTKGLLFFDGGVFTAQSINMAAKSGIGTGAATATLTVSDGTFTVLSDDALMLASQTGSGSASGTLNLFGGIFTSNADILDGGGTATSTLLLDGGTLNLSGHAIGSTSQRVDVVQMRSGALLNLGQLNGGDPLVKTGTGMLTLAGTNTYSAATVVNSGTLRLTSPACQPLSTSLYLLNDTAADLAFSER